MTFLQPLVLWALPLILLPVVIHLINRMRHRSQPWAAMRFLLSATRSSMGHAKLRQFLILLFRVLAVLMLILFLSRPLAGGWLGWALSPAPDVIMVLFDRSASMELQAPGNPVSRREQALKLITQTAADFQEKSHLVWIDSALRTPQEISNPSALATLAVTQPTDTAADLPALLNTALNWLVDNKGGTAEIWIASDLQRSNWHPEDPRWKNVITEFASLPQRVRFRLLAMNSDPASNASISLHDLIRRKRGEEQELRMALDIQRNSEAPASMPIQLMVDGSQSQAEVALEGESLRWRHKIELGSRTNSGWGFVQAPADGNSRDNSAFFVFPGESSFSAAVIAQDAQSGRFLQFAAADFSRGKPQPAEQSAPSTAAQANWRDKSLIVWQGALPEGVVADRISTFVEEGGIAIFLPPGEPDAKRFLGLGWGDVQSAGKDKTFRIVRWDEDQGPLARTDEGLSLPLNQALFQTRQSIVGHQNVLASFDDGHPFLVRLTAGRGEIYFCSSLPNPDWSTLGEGPVLVPMLQRSLQAGSRRVQQVMNIACGELSPAEVQRNWQAIDTTEPKDIRLHAGIYQSGDRFVAVNRPEPEDNREALTLAVAQGLFEGLPFQLFQDTGSRMDQLQGDLWRFLLTAMLLFLIAEAMLILPSQRPAQLPGGSERIGANKSNSGRVPEPAT